MHENKIDINQRIPLDVLEVALQGYLDGNYSNEYLMEQLNAVYNGPNRLKKALRIVNKIIIHNPIINYINEHKEEIKQAIKVKSDRNIILISLLNSAFPFSFYVLKSFAKYFDVQDLINSDTVKKNIANVYGGNRATENGIYSVVPMFLEAELFTRPKQGLYEFIDPIQLHTKISYKIYEEAYKSVNSINEIIDYMKNEPYFMFVRDVE